MVWPFYTLEEQLTAAKAENSILVEFINTLKSFSPAMVDKLIRVRRDIAILELRIANKEKLSGDKHVDTHSK